MFSGRSKGFTLIELLVVISIIALLSSVVLSSLNSARNKAKTAAFKEELVQLRNVLQLEHSDTGSYAALNTSAGWGSATTNSSAGTVVCDTLYNTSSPTSSYTSQANAICKKIVEISGGTYSLYVRGNTIDYSVGGYLYAPNELLYCVGSTGITNGLPYTVSPDVYASPGCLGSF